MGADRLRPTDLMRRLEAALEELGMILAAAEKTLMRLHQLLLTVGVMRAKKDNGGRILDPLPEIARLWSTCREDHVP
eukprot:6816645-Pyramimonas_sp.AAC.1